MLKELFIQMLRAELRTDENFHSRTERLIMLQDSGLVLTWAESEIFCISYELLYSSNTILIEMKMMSLPALRHKQCLGSKATSQACQGQTWTFWKLLPFKGRSHARGEDASLPSSPTIPKNLQSTGRDRKDACKGQRVNPFMSEGPGMPPSAINKRQIFTSNNV